MLWVGPALIFSSATAISMLGWDNKVRSILSTSFPHSGKIHTIQFFLYDQPKFFVIPPFLLACYRSVVFFLLPQFAEQNNMPFIFAVLLGALNDRLLLVNPTDINPRQKKGVEIRSCLVGLLEPLLIGFATMQQHFEQKLDLSEVLYQITSRYLFIYLLDSIVHFLVWLLITPIEF